MDLTLLIDLWKDRPFLPHNTTPPPPPTPHSYYWTTPGGLHKYAADQNSDRSVTGSTEPTDCMAA